MLCPAQGGGKDLTPIETFSTPPVNRLANGARTEPCRNVRSQFRSRQHWFRFRSCSLSEWNAVGGGGENGTARQKGDSGGTKHGNSGGTKQGTKAKDGESDEIGTLGLRQQRTGQDGKSDEIGTLGDGGKGQDGKSDGTHGWKRRSSRMRCLL